MELSGNYILRALNVRHEESWQVRQFMFLSFLQGFGVAVFFTVSNAIFLSHFTVDELPIVYMVAAVLMFLTGRVYSYFDKNFPVARVLKGALIVIILSIVLLSWALSTGNYIWLPVIFMVWHRILFLISDTGFWSLPTLLFDVRQAKRLFSVISGGDVPAQLIGSLTVSVLAPFLPLFNILWLAAFAFIIAFYVLTRLLRHPTSQSHEEKEEKHLKEKMGNQPWWAKIFKSEFILAVAGLFLFITLANTFIEFSFLTGVEEKFKSERELASFFGIFFGFSNAVIIIFKLFWSGRVIDKLGVKRSLLVLPVILLVASLTMLVIGAITGKYTTMMWFFAGMILFAEIFKKTLQEPVFMAIIQPLQTHLRVHAHFITDVVVQSIGLGLAGLGLYACLEIFHGINLTGTTYLLIALIGGWIAFLFFTYRQYLALLSHSLKKRFLEGTALTIKDKNATRILLQKLQSPYPEEVLYSIDLIEKTDFENFTLQLPALLLHPHEEVVIYALKKIEEQSITSVKEEILKMMDTDVSSTIKEAAIRSYCAIEEDSFDAAFAQLESHDLQIRKGAITGLLKTGDVEAMVVAGQHLVELIHSLENHERMIAARLIGDLGIKNFYKPLQVFFDDEDINVKKSAIKASGLVCNPKLMPQVLVFLKDKGLYRDAIDALAMQGDACILLLKENYYSVQNNKPDYLARIIQLCGKIDTPLAHEFLFEILPREDVKTKDAILHTLRQIKYHVPDTGQVKVTMLLDECLSEKFWNYCAIHILQQHSDTDLLAQALIYENKLITERLFNLLSFIYDPVMVRKIKEGLNTGHKGKIANALEMIQNHFHSKLQAALIPLLEEHPAERRMQLLDKQFSFTLHKPEEILMRILDRGGAGFYSWTLAVALYISPGYIGDSSEIIPYLHDSKKLIRENAATALESFLQRPAGHHEKTKHSGNTFKTMVHEEKMTESLAEIEKIFILKSTKIFADTPESVLSDIAGILVPQQVSKGQVIFSKGDYGNRMYIIYLGEISIHDETTQFAVLKDRDFFGELALLDPEPRSATATALTDALLLHIDEDDFFELMAERPEVARGILKIVVQRLRNQNRIIAGGRS